MTSNRSKNQSSTQTRLNDSNRSTVAVINSAPSLQWYNVIRFSTNPSIFFLILSVGELGTRWRLQKEIGSAAGAVIVLVDFIVEQCFRITDVLYQNPNNVCSFSAAMNICFSVLWWVDRYPSLWHHLGDVSRNSPLSINLMTHPEEFKWAWSIIKPSSTLCSERLILNGGRELSWTVKLN